MKLSSLLNWNLIIGIILELSAVLLYNPITNYFYSGGSWPVGPFLLASIYAAGIYFIFRSSVAFALKLILCYWWIGVVAYFGAESIITYLIESREYQYEAYLVPEGYHGVLKIEFGREDGEVPAVEDDQVVLIIHPDGTLRTTFSRRRWRHFADEYPRFYYVNGAGTRTLIKQVGDTSIGKEEVFVQYLDTNLRERKFLVCTQKEHEAYFN